MTPREIEVLLHCYYSNDPNPRNEDVVGVHERLCKQGLIVQRTDRLSLVFNTTALGRAMVTAICNVPLPRTVYLWS